MPVFEKSDDGTSFLLKAHEAGREVAYRLSREGMLFLTEILNLRPGDECRPSDLQLLKDRGWASIVEITPEPIEPEPEPEPTPVPEPRVVPPDPGPEPKESSRSSMSRRTRAREVALQVLYQIELNPAGEPAHLERFMQRRLKDARLIAFARALVDGVRAHLSEIDDRISSVAENWRIDRMAVTDRTILRLGAFEILYLGEDVPRKVAINEALELAKRYSTAQSSRFVNGILDRIEPAGAEPTEPAPDPESEPALNPGSGPGARGLISPEPHLRGADLHIHTTHSDGSCSPGEVVRAAAALHLSALAITDHDTLSALDVARSGGGSTCKST